MRRKKHKSEDGEEFEPPTLINSPGFLTQNKKLVFEQIPDNAYAMYDVENNKLLIAETGPVTKYVDAENNTMYVPMRRAPWPLSKPKLTFTLLEEKGLWEDISQFVYDHIDVVEPELYDVLTAWVFATYLPEVWRVVPYVFFYGPVATGKTRGLETLQALAYRGILGANVSAASLFRGCDLWHPTICLDETEIYSKVERADIIGLLNAGYRKGQYAWRVKNTEQGQELEMFDVFGFKALSGTEARARLAKTLESRSIKIRMIKNTRPIAFLVDLEKAEELRSQLLMWRFLKLRQLFGEQCELSEPSLEVPPTLNFANGRLIELFQPLLAVANEGHENIVKYARKVYEIRQLEEETSVEAMILNALIESESKVEARVILTKDIRNTLNEDIPKKEQFKTRTVGRIMRRLGFLPKHTRQGNGWIWNDSRLKLLKARYLPEGTLPQEGSQTSLSSQTSQAAYDVSITPIAPSEAAVKCEYCGNFPVAYELTYSDGTKLRKCPNCVEHDKQKGFKFVVKPLTEVSQNNEC